MFKYLRTKIAAAVSSGKGGGGQLPPIPPPKTKPKQQAHPSYRSSLRPSTSSIPKNDLNLANTDILATYRTGRNTAEVIRNLARANPDLDAAL